MAEDRRIEQGAARDRDGSQTTLHMTISVYFSHSLSLSLSYSLFLSLTTNKEMPAAQSWYHLHAASCREVEWSENRLRAPFSPSLSQEGKGKGVFIHRPSRHSGTLPLPPSYPRRRSFFLRARCVLLEIHNNNNWQGYE